MIASALPDKERFKRIFLELTGSCNLACGFCPHGIRNGCAVSPEHLSRIIPQIADYTSEIRPHLLGEPLLYPYFQLFLDLCGRYGLNVKITTNGTLLDKEHQKLLLDNSVREINFSLQSYNIQSHGDAECFADRLFSFAQSNEAVESGVYINFRFWNIENGIVPEAHSALYQRLLERYGILHQESACKTRSLRLSGKRRLSFDGQFDWPSASAGEISLNGRCHGAVSHIGILSDGRVVPCCLDAEGAITLGNIFEQNLSAIIVGSRLEKMKSGFLNGPFAKICAADVRTSEDSQ